MKKDLFLMLFSIILFIGILLIGTSSSSDIYKNKYEYRIDYCNLPIYKYNKVEIDGNIKSNLIYKGENNSILEKELNILGKECWEIIEITPIQGSIMGYKIGTAESFTQALMITSKRIIK